MSDGTALSVLRSSLKPHDYTPMQVDDPPTTLLLCRHGESTWNASGRIQGQSPEAGGLSTLGRWQAGQLAKRLCTAGIDLLYSSDLRRAVETAAIVADALDLKIRLDPRWREVDLGRWQGLTGQEVKACWPEEWTALGRGEDLPRGGGETYAQVQARAMQAMMELTRHYPGQTVAVICHGGPIRLCLSAVEGYPIRDLGERAVPIPNTSVTVIRALAGRFRLESVADASHLAEAAVEEQSLARGA